MKRLALALPLLAAAGAVLAQPAPAPEPDPDARARAAFADVFRVLTSPRCKNCHPIGDRPLQGDAGAPHAQNISRQSEKNGLRCTTCHREKNGSKPGSPPGAKVWHLPPAEHPMVFEGRTPRELCEQLKDPAQTGDKDLAELIEHVTGDPLVLWGWSPGPGRKPPPLPHSRFAAAFRAWVDSGAACPE